MLSGIQSFATKRAAIGCVAINRTRDPLRCLQDLVLYLIDAANVTEKKINHQKALHRLFTASSQQKLPKNPGAHPVNKETFPKLCAYSTDKGTRERAA